ncbi:MAG: hypothetical protein KGZ39_06905 [Simkania sp.]|nr:hypothetical protein [Simkania sp.]
MASLLINDPTECTERLECPPFKKGHFKSPNPALRLCLIALLQLPLQVELDIHAPWSQEFL